MAKVLYLITKSNWGGAQRYVFDLATHLVTRSPSEKWQAVVAVGDDGLLVQKLREKNIRVIPLPEAQRDIAIFKEIKLLYRLFKIIRQEKPSVMHVNSSKLAGLSAFVGWCLKTFTIAHLPLHIIFTAHGWPFNEDRNKLAKAAMYFFSWLTSLFATITVTITQKDFEQGKRMWFVGRKMRLVYNGIDEIIFYDKDEARRQINSVSPPTPSYDKRGPGGDIWIGTIAELTPNKGLEYLAKAAEQIPNAYYIVIGEGELRSDLKNLIQRSDLGARFKLAGFLPEANRYLKAFDIFVLPSLKEGLPYTLLEAAQAGLPVVASNIGGIPDIVGQAGMLVPPKNPKLLARSLSALIKDEKLRHSLGQQLQSRVAKEFNFENFLSQTYDLYI